MAASGFTLRYMHMCVYGSRRPHLVVLTAYSLPPYPLGAGTYTITDILAYHLLTHCTGRAWLWLRSLLTAVCGCLAYSMHMYMCVRRPHLALLSDLVTFVLTSY